jgi:hypothetical protein
MAENHENAKIELKNVKKFLRKSQKEGYAMFHEAKKGCKHLKPDGKCKHRTNHWHGYNDYIPEEHFTCQLNVCPYAGEKKWNS